MRNWLIRMKTGARMAAEGGSTQEWRSATLPRYARMTRQVEALIAGPYLAGAQNTDRGGLSYARNDERGFETVCRRGSSQ